MSKKKTLIQRECVSIDLTEIELNVGLQIKMDDWTIDVKPPGIVNVPSFIRLFIIARILKTTVGNNDIKNTSSIKKLITEINDPKTNQVVQFILTRLIKHGIKKYMKCNFNENEQLKAIEIIFNDIILKKFHNEYQETMTYFANGNIASAATINSEYYKILVFSTDDLMHLIFQFVELEANFTGDLINCSLVNSHWLYQSWNPNSIYHFDLGRLIVNTKDYNVTNNTSNVNNRNGKHTSKWQRIAKVKSIKYLTFGYDLSKNNYLLQNLSMLRSVVRVQLFFSENHIQWLKILYRERHNIEWFDVVCISIKRNVLTPLTLLNAKLIRIRTIYFYITWTDNCHTLVLKDFKNIDNKWCQYVIDNCDCTGIKKIVFDKITFCDDSMNAKENSTKLIIKQFAEKFNGVKEIVFQCSRPKGLNTRSRSSNCDTCDVRLLWLLRYLSPIINTNNTKITLKPYLYFPDFFKVIRDTDITSIYELDICTTKNENDNFNLFKPAIVKNKHLEYIRFYSASSVKIVPLLRDICHDCDNDNNDNNDNNDDYNHDCNLQMAAAIAETAQDKIVFASLKMIDITDNDGDINASTAMVNFNAINDLLTLNFIHNNKVFVKLSMSIDTNHNETLINDLEVSFDQMCKNLFCMLTKEQIPIDLKISINDISQSWYYYALNPIFKKYFYPHQGFKHEYKVPICNKYCKAIASPSTVTTFKLTDTDYDDCYGCTFAILQIKNAQKA